MGVNFDSSSSLIFVGSISYAVMSFNGVFDSNDKYKMIAVPKRNAPVLNKQKYW